MYVPEEVRVALSDSGRLRDAINDRGPIPKIVSETASLLIESYLQAKPYDRDPENNDLRRRHQDFDVDFDRQDESEFLRLLLWRLACEQMKLLLKDFMHAFSQEAPRLGLRGSRKERRSTRLLLDWKDYGQHLRNISHDESGATEREEVQEARERLLVRMHSDSFLSLLCPKAAALTVGISSEDLPDRAQGPAIRILKSWSEIDGEPIHIHKPDGYLALLEKASRIIGAQYCWLPDHALVFILCRDAPPPRLITGNAEVRNDYGCLSRIRLEFIPTVTESQLIEAFRSIKSRIMVGDRQRIKVRKMAVASFVYSHGLSIDLAEPGPVFPWRDLFETWNREQAGKQSRLCGEEPWLYRHLCRFKQDAREGRSHLLMPDPYSWKQGPGKPGTRGAQGARKPWFKEHEAMSFAELAESAEEHQGAQLVQQAKTRERNERAKARVISSLVMNAGQSIEGGREGRIKASSLSYEQLDQVLEEATSPEDIDFIDFEEQC